MARALLTLRGRRAAEDLGKLCAGELCVPRARLQLARAPPWRAAIDRSALEVPRGSTKQAPFRFKCTGCSSVCILDGKPLKLQRGWPKVSCVRCGLSFRVGRAIALCCSMEVLACRCGQGPQVAIQVPLARFFGPAS